MTTLTEGARRRDAGQQQSLGILLADDVANFDRIIASYPVGDKVSINLVRSQLDAVEIPESSRGGLFSRAVKGGVLAPATVVAGGQEFPIFEASTGTSANRARVRVYVRTDPKAQG
ncbi:MAG: hypothetical protein ACYC1Z_03550 [Georgenia sp.]